MIDHRFRLFSQTWLHRCSPNTVRSISILVAIALTICVWASPAAIATAPSYGTWLRLPGVPGTIIVAGQDGAVPATNVFLEAAGGSGAKIAIVANRDALSRALADVYQEAGAEVVSIAASEANLLRSVTGVWLFERQLPLIPELRALHKRGGVLGASGEAAEWLGGAMVDGHDTLGVLPGFVIKTTYRDEDSIQATLERHPGHVAVVLPPAAVLRIAGRRAQVVTRRVTTVLPAGAGRAAMTKTWPEDSTLDLVTLSRAAVARAGALFPTAEPPAPEVVPGGTLYIAGGGQTPRGAMARFIDAAGGRNAKIVVIPTALGTGAVRMGSGDKRRLERHGARRVVIAHAATPEEAERPAFLEKLRGAGGIWFSGGRQWRLVDSYLDTTAHPLMHDVLTRGGAVAGSSAGASIQAEYMVRGHPLGNTVMMAEGYERGLGFLPGVAIDQHFTQRGRQGDLAAVKRRFPQLLGIGLDESTAVFVTGHVMEVVGDHEVSVYDRVQSVQAHERTRLRAGDRYDLRARRRLGRR